MNLWFIKPFDFFFFFLVYLTNCKNFYVINGPTKVGKRSVIYAMLLISRLFGKMRCQFG